MTALHCRECDDVTCKGFTTRALDEPKPLPAGPGSSEAARRAARKAVDDAVRAAKGVTR